MPSNFRKNNLTLSDEKIVKTKINKDEKLKTNLGILMRFLQENVNQIDREPIDNLINNVNGKTTEFNELVTLLLKSTYNNQVKTYLMYEFEILLLCKNHTCRGLQPNGHPCIYVHDKEIIQRRDAYRRRIELEKQEEKLSIAKEKRENNSRCYGFHNEIIEIIKGNECLTTEDLDTHILEKIERIKDDFDKKQPEGCYGNLCHYNHDKKLLESIKRDPMYKEEKKCLDDELFKHVKEILGGTNINIIKDVAKLLNKFSIKGTSSITLIRKLKSVNIDYKDLNKYMELNPNHEFNCRDDIEMKNTAHFPNFGDITYRRRDSAWDKIPDEVKEEPTDEVICENTVISQQKESTKVDDFLDSLKLKPKKVNVETECDYIWDELDNEGFIVVDKWRWSELADETVFLRSIDSECDIEINQTQIRITKN
jgi:hypothetical protein